MDYLDFDLQILPGTGRDYPVAVLRSPAGEARAIMHFPFDQLALESRLDKLQIALLRSGGQRRSVPSDEERAVQDFGQTLFEAVFTGEIRSRYDVSCERAVREERGLRLKLCIQSPELAALPWEFLYDPRQADYICLSRETPIVRYLELPQPVPSFKVTPPLLILGMVASPSNMPTLDVDGEKGRVERATANLRARGLVELIWLQGQTWRDLQRAMRGGPWHVFHFLGHGGYDCDRDEGFVALAGDDGSSVCMPAIQLARLLADHQSLRLVLLNACEGARGGKRDIFSSTASILVRHDIPAVIAMQYEITDLAAIEFARAFYEAVADGLPVDVAASEARKAVSLAVANTMEWGTPVLYMRTPDGVLFDMAAPPPLSNSTPAPEARPVEVAPVEPPVPAQVTPAKTVTQSASDSVVEDLAPASQSIPRPQPAARRLWPFLAVAGLVGLVIISLVLIVRPMLLTEIDKKYDELNKAGLALGRPLGPEKAAPAGPGRFREYQGGSIYWTPETGAHQIGGNIRDKWAQLGYELGPLGYPTTDEQVTPDGRGRYNHFENGSIYWTLETGAHQIGGNIRDKWAQLGWEESWLGYPISDEEPSSGKWTRQSRFEHGVIKWFPGTTEAFSN